MGKGLGSHYSDGPWALPCIRGRGVMNDAEGAKRSEVPQKARSLTVKIWYVRISEFSIYLGVL